MHLVINNQIGFTTSPDEARSSRYATDVAQMLQSPILHINGESPEDLVWAADFALQFRQEFGRDIILDMYCYRRLGHNETDQAAFTAPMQTKRIEARPTAAALYGMALRERGELTEQQEQDIRNDLWEGMEQAYLQMKENPADYILPATAQDADETPLPRTNTRTGISPELFQRIGSILTELPDSFTPHPTLEKRFLARRREAFREGGLLDWAMAESLAWGSLLTENHTVRLSGQDCQRGTFSQRHAVLHDFNDGSLYTPLEKLNHGTTAFRIYNSSLSEASVLGFEYGYALESPDALVMWEAQFGDFSNGAQVIVDQFIAAAEAKWNQKNRMVLLLPHGYEGAGSEHSSARMERYLQLCADDNMQVINPTTPAQYFHALRRQVHRNVHKPLIIFTPKSLLSRPEAVSPHWEFLASTRFREVLPDPDTPAPDQVTRAVFCTGKIYYDLAAYRRERNISDTVIIRLEQIYPLAQEQLTYLLAPYQKVRDFVWCQEEPSNMGAWGHLRNRLGRLFATSFRYAGRPSMACPAEGAKALHAAAQKRLIAAAFGPRAQS